jgi:hypothetical protein
LHAFQVVARATVGRIGDSNHSVDYDLPSFWIGCFCIGQNGRRKLIHVTGGDIANRFNQPRSKTFAARGDRGREMGELQWCRRHVSLADAYTDRFSGKPHLRLFALECVSLPCRRWKDADLLAWDIDPSGSAQSELL